ncbi:hypothetical protein FHT00_000294 [Sphingomonas insulae]|uniref:Anti-sigma factor NepR domain-containing protein n=1 Tax=Sphingomonas insulae TaxID=424800 RepID=A0ABN1HUP9_9SPHN|nr:hypothetical protein [Sphingomonas insulae]NIJ28366.1 hypothetical protein [Sphingomonas insulae]
MVTDEHHLGKAKHGDYVVRTPRPADALGLSLRGVFHDSPLPDDLLMLLRRLDRITH